MYQLELIFKNLLCNEFDVPSTHDSGDGIAAEQVAPLGRFEFE